MGSRVHLPYEVHRYSIERLLEFLTRHVGNDPHIVCSKPHATYFETYFQHLDAKTIVAEIPYIDRDFLEDFAAYYVRCFKDYHRKCIRLHFFTEDFTREDFEKLLRRPLVKKKLEELQKNYLGFVVVKRLPATVVGRTCLVTYQDDPDRRCFPIIRSYDANLFGIPLKVETLAFQEQDQTVAMCATSALWSMFQGTGILFHHHLPSPVEITQAATARAPSERALPNKGLDIVQMADAIREVGLAPVAVASMDEYVLKSSIYAYVGGRIPTVLGVTRRDPRKKDEPVRHAVAVTGYSLGHAKPAPYGETGFLLRASRIDEIYAHDDRIGPFARMPFVKGHSALIVNWTDAEGNVVQEEWQPYFMLIPLYHKIRIPFDVILENTVAFDGWIEALRQSELVSLPERLEWDVSLTTVNEFKTSLLWAGFLDDPLLRQRTLTQAMPRFMWQARASSGGSLRLELLFDATDILQGRLFVCAIGYDEMLAGRLSYFSEALLRSQVEALKEEQVLTSILEWFAQNSGHSASRKS
jgi:hypothetical protein